MVVSDLDRRIAEAAAAVSSLLQEQERLESVLQARCLKGLEEDSFKEDESLPAFDVQQDIDEIAHAGSEVPVSDRREKEEEKHEQRLLDDLAGSQSCPSPTVVRPSSPEVPSAPRLWTRPCSVEGSVVDRETPALRQEQQPPLPQAEAQQEQRPQQEQPLQPQPPLQQEEVQQEQREWGHQEEQHEQQEEQHEQQEEHHEQREEQHEQQEGHQEQQEAVPVHEPQEEPGRSLAAELATSLPEVAEEPQQKQDLDLNSGVGDGLCSRPLSRGTPEKRQDRWVPSPNMGEEATSASDLTTSRRPIEPPRVAEEASGGSRPSRPNRFRRPVVAESVAFPSDAAVASMSRKERIALLELQERQAGGDPTSASTRSAGQDDSAAASNPARRAFPTRTPAGRVSCDLSGGPAGEEEDMAARMSRQERIAFLERAALSPAVSSAAEQQDADSRREGLPQAWMEQRRRQRRERLNQQLSGKQPQPPRASSLHAPLDRGSHRRALSGRGARQGKGEALPHEEVAHGSSSASAGPAPSAPSEVRTMLEDLEEICIAGIDDTRWPAMTSLLTNNAHKFQLGGLMRAMDALARLIPTDGLPLLDQISKQRLIALLKDPVEALLSSLLPHSASLDAAMVMKTMQVSAAAGLTVQACLDVLLAQLLMLLKRDATSFSPSAIAQLAGCIGTLHEAGLSAKQAVSGHSVTTNKRCCEALANKLLRDVNILSVADLGHIGGGFFVGFMDDAQRRRALEHAAEMDAGLAEASQEWLPAMQAIEQAVRQNSFAFIAGLPDKTKDYLMRVKTATAQAVASPLD